MTREQQRQHRQQVLSVVHLFIAGKWTPPSYKATPALLTNQKISTRRGNPWTQKRLFRFLQNAGYSGLWGLSKVKNKPKVKPAL